MATGWTPAQSVSFATPIGTVVSGFLYSPAPGFLAFMPIANPSIMFCPPGQPISLQTNSVVQTNALDFTVEDHEEPMHQLEAEKPIDREVEEEHRLRNAGVKKEIKEDVDYSDMPQLTRMDY